MENNNLQHMDSGDESNCSGDVLRLDGLESDFTRHFDLIGVGYLMASNHGVDMAVKSKQLCPEVLGDDGDLWWPESGIKLNTETLDAVYARSRSVLGAGAIECDFAGMPNGFSIVFLPGDFDASVFELVAEARAVDFVSSDWLSKERLMRKPHFNSCPCCAGRAERIRLATSRHPISRILQTYEGKDTQLEFHIATPHADMLSVWDVHEVRNWSGEVTCVGEDHVLRLDACMIHAIQIVNDTRRGEAYSILRCYHSLGGVMMEISVPGTSHAADWHAICLSEDSNYSSTNGVDPYMGTP